MKRLLSVLLPVILGAVANAADPLLLPGDRVAFLGGTLIERMQTAGALEAELQCRRPDWQLTVRNLGWSGDDVHGIARKRFDSPEEGFQRMLRDVAMANPTVVLVAYGAAEASDGAVAVDRFEKGLRRLVVALKDRDRRVILLAPVGMPGFRIKGYDQLITQCRAIVERVGRDNETAVVSVDWSPQEDELTVDRLLPNAQGYGSFAKLVADHLVGGQSCSNQPPGLPDLIAAKNQLFFHRYRPQNETYLFLFRKHEQGNNAVEIPQFDPLIQQADQRIWKLARSAASQIQPTPDP